MSAISARRRALLLCAGLAIVLTGVQIQSLGIGGGMTAPVVSVFISVALAGALIAFGLVAPKAKHEPVTAAEELAVEHGTDVDLAAQDIKLLSNSQLDDYFAEIHGELSQADRLVGDAVGDLVASFRYISTLTRSQQDISLAIVGMAVPADGGPMRQLLERQMLIAGQIEQEVDAAVVSLQFGDLVAQLLAHTKLRVDAIGTALQRVDRLDAGQERGALSGRPQRVHEGVSRAVLAANAASRGKPVVQHGMQTGEIELF